MNRRDAILGLVGLGAAPIASFAQAPSKVWRIGVLDTARALANANLAAFSQALLDLGYVEGKNYVIDYRSADQHAKGFPGLAPEMVRQKVDIIVTRGTPATLAAKSATATIPIVTSSVTDPLQIVASLARPGGNVTGLTAMNAELQGKRVELLREIVPGLKKLASLHNFGSQASRTQWKALEQAALSIRVQPLLLEVRTREELGSAIERGVAQGAGALAVGADSLTVANGTLIAGLAAKLRIPAMFQYREPLADGGLISFGVNYPDQYRRVAAFVDKILKGAKPGDLPMEQPTKFDLVVNLKTAKALGITIPQSVLIRADEVIE